MAGTLLCIYRVVAGGAPGQGVVPSSGSRRGLTQIGRRNSWWVKSMVSDMVLDHGKAGSFVEERNRKGSSMSTRSTRDRCVVCVRGALCTAARRQWDLLTETGDDAALAMSYHAGNSSVRLVRYALCVKPGDLNRILFSHELRAYRCLHVSCHLSEPRSQMGATRRIHFGVLL